MSRTRHQQEAPRAFIAHQERCPACRRNLPVHQPACAEGLRLLLAAPQELG